LFSTEREADQALSSVTVGKEKEMMRDLTKLATLLVTMVTTVSALKYLRAQLETWGLV